MVDNLLRPLGPLILVSVFYEASGILMAWLVKQFFWVPHRFRYGIIVAGGWGNYGDIRELFLDLQCEILLCHDQATSVLMSITGSTPFNGASDQNLSVAYLAAFLLIFCVSKDLRTVRIEIYVTFTRSLYSPWAGIV